jgi:hypothetical protein
VDDEFEREYMQLMFEAQGKVASKTPAAPLLVEATPPSDDEYEDQAEGSGMAFKLLMKKGGRDDRTKEIMVRASQRLAENLSAHLTIRFAKTLWRVVNGRSLPFTTPTVHSVDTYPPLPKCPTCTPLRSPQPPVWP